MWRAEIGKSSGPGGCDAGSQRSDYQCGSCGDSLEKNLEFSAKMIVPALARERTRWYKREVEANGLTSREQKLNPKRFPGI